MMLLLLVAVVLPAQAVGAFQQPAAALIVTTTSDSGPGSLRQAIADAVAGDIISFDLPDHSTITLASELLVTKNLTISGPGPVHLTISGNNTVRVLQVNGSTLALDGVTITAGNNAGGRGRRHLHPQFDEYADLNQQRRERQQRCQWRRHLYLAWRHAHGEQ